MDQFLVSNLILGNLWGFSAGSVVKNLPANAGDAGLIPGSERYPGEENGNPLQYSCLGNPIDRGRKRVRHNWAAKQHCTLTWVPWKCQNITLIYILWTGLTTIILYKLLEAWFCFCGLLLLGTSLRLHTDLQQALVHSSLYRYLYFLTWPLQLLYNALSRYNHTHFITVTPSSTHMSTELPLQPSTMVACPGETEWFGQARCPRRIPLPRFWHSDICNAWKLRAGTSKLHFPRISTV